MTDDSTRTLLHILRTSLFLVRHHGDSGHEPMLREVTLALERSIAALESATAMDPASSIP